MLTIQSGAGETARPQPGTAAPFRSHLQRGEGGVSVHISPHVDARLVSDAAIAQIPPFPSLVRSMPSFVHVCRGGTRMPRRAVALTPQSFAVAPRE